MSAPKLRDVRKLADSRAVFELDIPLAELPGFPVEYQAGGGQVHARMSFGREQGHAMAQVALRAELAATCQRCLGPMQLRVDTHSPVLIVESEQEAEGAPGGWETFLAPEGRLVFAALVAEELLLALPIVPLHAQVAQCQPLASDVRIEPADAQRSAEVARGPGGAAGRGVVGTASADASGAAVGEQPPGKAPASEAATTRPFADLRALLERGGKRG